jgi:hypothetical protein
MIPDDAPRVWEQMANIPVGLQPVDRTIAQQAAKRFSQMPKHTDIRRRLVKCYVDENRLFINIPAKAAPQFVMVNCFNSGFGYFYAIRVVTKAGKEYRTCCDQSLKPGFRATTVHTHLSDTARAYDIEFTDRAAYDEQVARLTLGDNEVEQPELIFADLSELRQIYFGGILEPPPLTAHECLQVGYVNQVVRILGRFADFTKEAKAISDSERSAVGEVFPELVPVLKPRTGRSFLRQFWELDEAALEAVIANRPVHYQLLVSDDTSEALKKIISAIYLPIAFHPTLTSLGLRLPCPSS